MVVSDPQNSSRIIGEGVPLPLVQIPHPRPPSNRAEFGACVIDTREKSDSASQSLSFLTVDKACPTSSDLKRYSR
jgi:hypothetical protein